MYFYGLKRRHIKNLSLVRGDTEASLGILMKTPNYSDLS
jgi:hypothetical protein